METIFEYIDFIQRIMSEYGITPQFLLVLGGLCFLAFMVTFREVLGWYLRTQHIREELQSVREELADLRREMSKMTVAPQTEVPKPAPTVFNENGKATSRAFPLHH